MLPAPGAPAEETTCCLAVLHALKRQCTAAPARAILSEMPRSEVREQSPRVGQLQALTQSQVSPVVGEVFPQGTILPHHAGRLWVMVPMNALDVLLMSLLHGLERTFLLR